MERIGAPVERKAIKMMPWPRAYRTVLNTPGSLLYSTARTKQREKLFKWVGPITDLTVGLIARKDRNIQIYSIEDVQQYKIGSILDGAPEQLVLQAGIKESNLDRLADPELNIKKLQAGRIDLFAFNAPTTRYLMIKLGINPDEFEVVYSLKTADLYFAFHRETDDRFIAAMNRELLEMKKVDSKGVSSFQTIVDNYLNP
jgi:polar amino acid transport system substrate-binding protein